MRNNMGIYRGRRLDYKVWNVKWIKGGYLHQTDYYGKKVDKHFILDGTDTGPDDVDIGEIYEVDPETVGEYTGLTDKKGTRIFEGDIVSIFVSRYKTPLLGEVKYGEYIHSKCDEYECNRYGFFVKVQWQNYCDNTGFEVSKETMQDMIVIGNIHDNPELLEV